MQKYSAPALVAFAGRLLTQQGLEKDKAESVARILVEGDLLGHDTHGLALLPAYLGELEKGSMTNSGEPEIINQLPAATLWDGRRLPGPYLVEQALATASTMAHTYGTGTVSIRRSHHIACLAAFLKPVTDQGLVVQILCSDPNAQSVAPYGGRQAVFTPDPLAIGIPTSGDPILIDISASITTNGLVNRYAANGQKFSYPCLLDARGVPTDDPLEVTENGGTILPLGGLETGHKGFGLALMIEALTGGLCGFGRADAAEGWGASVFVQVLHPAAFGGMEDFKRQLDWLAEACRSCPPAAGFEEVRLPGQRGLARRTKQLADGVELHESIMPGLEVWAEKLGVEMV